MSTVEVGTRLPTVRVVPTSVSLFRFSATTWNPHRIHYDQDYAATEGYPGVLVQGHLHGCWLLTAVRSWAGERAVVEQFSWQNRHHAVPGERLTIDGRVTEVDGPRIRVELMETNEAGVVCAPATALLRLVGEVV